MELLKNEQIDKAVDSLRQGGIVVFPTETSYGMGCDASKQGAVHQIFLIKERPVEKSMLVVVPSVDEAKKYLVWNDLLGKIAKKYWPGPLTIVGEYTGEGALAEGVIAPDHTVAIRVTNHSILKELTEKLKMPIVATSANLGGGQNLYSAGDVIKVFGARELQPSAVIEGGELPCNPPTTIVSVVNNELKILRQGEIKVQI